MAGRALILDENLSVPFDRRVWQESRALADAGWEVHVVCPRGEKRDAEPYVEIEGVHIHRFPLRMSEGGAMGFAREYAAAIWHCLRLSRRIGRVDVVQLCNPPDIMFLAALPAKLRGARIIFDHHDVVPELYLSRFGGRRDLLYRVVCLLERITFAFADVVIATNESYRSVALSRGRKAPERVFVVRNAPAGKRLQLVDPDPALRNGAPHLLCYLGVQGPQDGVDYALRALARLRDELGRRDWHATFMGTGDAFEDNVALAARLGLLDDLVTFTGYVTDEEVSAYLSTADVCLAPDPMNPLNGVSTMTKVMEYMAAGRAIVSFDLPEARVSAAEAALYAPPNDEGAYASLVAQLLDEPDARQRMGRIGRERVAGELSWDRSREALLAAYSTAERT